MNDERKERQLAIVVKYLNLSSEWKSHFEPYGACTQVGKKEMESSRTRDMVEAW